MIRAATVFSRSLYRTLLMLKGRTRNDSTGISSCLDGVIGRAGSWPCKRLFPMKRSARGRTNGAELLRRVFVRKRIRSGNLSFGSSEESPEVQ
jgi:hypothetical protein